MMSRTICPRAGSERGLGSLSFSNSNCLSQGRWEWTALRSQRQAHRARAGRTRKNHGMAAPDSRNHHVLSLMLALTVHRTVKVRSPTDERHQGASKSDIPLWWLPPRLRHPTPNLGLRPRGLRPFHSSTISLASSTRPHCLHRGFRYTARANETLHHCRSKIRSHYLHDTRLGHS